MDDPSLPLGFLGILREAFKIPSRSGKLFLFIAIAFLVPMYLLDLAKNFAIEAFTKDISAKFYKFYIISNMTIQNDGLAKSYIMSNKTAQDNELCKSYIKSGMIVPNDEQNEQENLSMEILKDAGFIILILVVFMLVSSIISFFTRVATIYGLAATKSRKHLTNMELAIWIRCMWKQPVITWLDILLFNFGFFFLFFWLSVIVAVTWMASIPLAVVALLLDNFTILYYFYLIVVWELSIVVSVLKLENYGIQVVGKASELIKGSKRRGCILFALIMLVGFVIWGLMSLASLYAPQNQAMQLGIGLISQMISCSAAIFMAISNTLFCFACKKNC